MNALTARWMRSVPGLREAALRAAYMRAELARKPLARVAVALDELCGRAEQADPVAREVLAAAVTMLADPAAEKLAGALRELAKDEALLPLGRLLRRKRRDPALEPPPAEERQVTIASNGRTLTLGERRALARRPSRAALDRLLRDPHPMVIHNVLDNPRVTEDDVVRLAARRPAYPDVLAEIARHVGWSQRARVRMSLVQNPATPAEIAVPMVRLLIRPELSQVAAAPGVPAIVRAAARELLERRPPVPERRGDKDLPQ